jgi:hypothetical protein
MDKKLVTNKLEVKKYKRKKSLKKTIETFNKMKNNVPNIIFRAEKLIVTLKNKHQLNKWLEIYPNGVYTINQ